MTYDGRNIADIIADQGHPALNPEAGDKDVQYSDFYQQMSAAKAWNYETFYGQGWETRAMMTGQHIIENTLRVMLAHDAREKAKLEAESNRRNR